MADRAARILVVDDETPIQTLLSYPLQREGYDVVTAADGREALERFEEMTPDLVVLDVMMPRMDGFAVLKELKRRPSTAGIPVIMLTAKAQQEDQVQGWAAGIADYVTKPFSPGELSGAVERVSRMSGEELHARRMQTLTRLSVAQHA